MVVHGYNSGSWKVQAGGSEAEGHPWLPSQFQASLGYSRLWLNKAKQTRDGNGLATLAVNHCLPSPPRKLACEPHGQGGPGPESHFTVAHVAFCSSSHRSIYRNRRKRSKRRPSAYREVGGEKVGRAGERDSGVVVLAHTAAAELHPGLPHALRSRLQAGQQVVGAVNIQEVGGAWGVWSHVPTQRVKDKDDGEHGGGNDNPTAKVKQGRFVDREGLRPERTPSTQAKPCFCTPEGEADF